MSKKELTPQVVILGAGITGLTIGFYLQRANIDFAIVERSPVAGGVIQTHRREGFTYETGPNTGIIAHPEVAELFELLAPACELELADPKAENRWILKKGKWTPLPSGMISGIKTPLFSMKDKLRLLSEPLRKRGENPMETISELVKRRMGKSFLDYAVDPFISGIYAGNPDLLVTKYALPKLYNLEQQYGSFIIGGVKKAREPKSDRDKKATRKVFSAKGGFKNLIAALQKAVPDDKIFFNADNVSVSKAGNNFITRILDSGRQKIELTSEQLVTTTSGGNLKQLFDFIESGFFEPILSLEYARVVQVIMAFKKWKGPELNAFGGLIPSKEQRNVLGVLFPSSIFKGRAPAEGALLSVFLGGIKKPEIYNLDDEKILELVNNEMDNLLQTSKSEAAFIEIHRYLQAIPQYGKTSPERLDRIAEIEKLHPGLTLAGNIRDGIGIADRIKQATEIAGKLSLIIKN
jgi:protoporphyrinogen/coproporphyrinogen III oxidase